MRIEEWEFKDILEGLIHRLDDLLEATFDTGYERGYDKGYEDGHFDELYNCTVPERD